MRGRHVKGIVRNGDLALRVVHGKRDKRKDVRRINLLLKQRPERVERIDRRLRLENARDGKGGSGLGAIHAQDRLETGSRQSGGNLGRRQRGRIVDDIDNFVGRIDGHFHPVGVHIEGVAERGNFTGAANVLHVPLRAGFCSSDCCC